MSPALWKHRSSTLPGWTACRTVFRTVRPPKHCGRSAISISLSCRRSNHRAASTGTDKPFTDIAHNGLHRWVHRNPPRAGASASRWALRVARVPPMDYRHKPPRRGVNFGRRSGVNIQRRLTAWTPIRYVNRAYSRATLATLYRMAGVGLVTPLRDGMNLVAKEYVAAQDPEDPGVLVLSQFAGAAEELESAILVNPHEPEAMAAAIKSALDMPLAERQERHKCMFDHLASNTI